MLPKIVKRRRKCINFIFNILLPVLVGDVCAVVARVVHVVLCCSTAATVARRCQESCGQSSIIDSAICNNMIIIKRNGVDLSFACFKIDLPCTLVFYA